MTHTVNATYENGVLKLEHPVPLQEQQQVQVTIHTTLSRAERTAGLLRWRGDPQVLRQIAEGDEFGILESP